MTHIGIDILGGDWAPEAALSGSLSALNLLGENTILHFIGPQNLVQQHLDEQHPALAKKAVIHPTDDFVEMGENPVKALQKKPQASINIGCALMAKGVLNGFASAGNSGALMVAAMHFLKPINGVSRPCVVSAFPQKNEHKNVLVDVGINADAKPEMLVQFAKLGQLYSHHVLGVKSPRVALLNTGAEPSKGSLLYQKTHELLTDAKDITFVGNLEARDFYDGVSDVTVCDGFTGNVVLKQAEGFYNLLKHQNIEDPFIEKFNYEEYGGTPILGVNGNVILGHGISSSKAICNMILATEKVAKANLALHINKAFNK